MLEAIQPTPDDRLVFLGDYIDRGPASRQVIDRLIALAETHDVITIFGNHEEMMFRVLQGKAAAGWWMQYGGKETLASYDFEDDFSVIPPEHISFLGECFEYHEEEQFFFTHANYVANEPLASQPAEALRWQSLTENLPEPHESGKIAIVGHTSQKTGEVYDAGHLRCIDTFCHGGGWLTAMEVTTGQLWQADKHGEMRETETRRTY